MADEHERMFNQEMGPLFQLATALHEMYLNLRQAGFTENQALYLTTRMIIKQEDIDIQMEGE
jgi:hypothetical protein